MVCPRDRVVYFTHPDSDARANLTVWRSLDDATTWPSHDTRTVYPNGAAYSDSVILDPASNGGRADNVGVLFERDSYSLVSFAAVNFASSTTPARKE